MSHQKNAAQEHCETKNTDFVLWNGEMHFNHYSLWNVLANGGVYLNVQLVKDLTGIMIYGSGIIYNGEPVKERIKGMFFPWYQVEQIDVV